MSVSRSTHRSTQQAHLGWRPTTRRALTRLALSLGAGCSGQEQDLEQAVLDSEATSPPQPGTQAYVDAVQALKLDAKK